MEIVSSMEKFRAKWAENKHLCVGLDTDYRKISDEVKSLLIKSHENFPITLGFVGQVIAAFNAALIDATKDIAACYKLNRAFYEGKDGVFALDWTLAYLRKAAPSVPVIFDAKYGDVGNSAEYYARYAFDELGFDAVTVSPYPGVEDGLDAFLSRKDKMTFVLCRTSNKGGKEFQDMKIKEVTALNEFGEPKVTFVSPVFMYIARKFYPIWDETGNCGLVVGATRPEELLGVRGAVGNMPILVPGVGAQGGDLKESVKAAIYTHPETKEKSLPAVFNASRYIIYGYGSDKADFQSAARKRAKRLNGIIRKILKTQGVI